MDLKERVKFSSSVYLGKAEFIVSKRQLINLNKCVEAILKQ